MLDKGLLALALVAAAAAVGCGEEKKTPGSPDPATERSDRPAHPPPGWRTFANRRAGFTVSVPRDWAARRRSTASLIRSPDRLLAVTVAADRSESGRTTRPRKYARATFRALPGFRKLRVRGMRRVARSPYPSARVEGTGVLARRGQRQRITVAAFRRRGRVTFTVVAFSAQHAPETASLGVLLASLRGRRPLL